ncbi:MAG: phosphate/phosphite/phosphonate ABC transporter substrate-binding protein [Syntrophales bacterium]
MKKRFPVALLCLVVYASFFSLPAAFSKQIVPFGFCPKYNPRIMYQLYQPFIDYLNENTPYQFEIKLSRLYRDTVERLGNKEILIASCGPTSYIRASARYPVKPILRPLSRGGKPYYHGIIFVRHDSLIQKFVDLKGKSFAFGPAWSTAGHILPEYHLRRAGIQLKDLREYAFLRHHDSVVNAVLKGRFDAGAVKDVVAYQHENKGLRFIYITDPIPTIPIIVHQEAPRELVAAVKSALLKIDPRDQNYIKRMVQWDEEFKYGFMETADSDYEVIRNILRSIPTDRDEKGPIRE